MTGPARRPIRRLAPEVVGRIAAGEVVERPASVVKELVENAFDAHARQVAVRIQGGGIERIVVADDGDGIPPEELELALERHATSKLEDDSELAGIASLGFRGEALASIASVARVEVLSRVPAEDAAAGRVADPAGIGPSFVAPRSVGTTVTVEGLFARLPARRKFLRSPAAEQVEITATIDRMHLARPEVGLSLEANGAEVSRYPPARSLRDAAAEVLGSEFAANPVAVRGQAGPFRWEGWLGRPPLSRSTLAGLQLVVNGRPVLSRPLAQAVRLGFADHLPRSRFPVGVLHLTIDPERVDVNVHPTKREVRLAGEAELADHLRRAVRAALGEGPAIAAVRSTRPSAEGRAGPAVPSVMTGAVPEGVDAAAATLRQRRLPTMEALPFGSRTPGPLGLELLGCVGELYWIATQGEDLVLVDQHAASERLLYDLLLAHGRLARQELVEPIRVSLSARQAACLEAEGRSVASAGFAVEPFGPGEWRILAVPAYRGRRAPPEELPRLLDELADGGRPSVPDGLQERTAASIACHAAVRGGDRIAPEAMRGLLEELAARPEGSYACPHGRPILIRLPRGRLDRWFGRSGA